MWKVDFSPESFADVQCALIYYLEKGLSTGEAFIQAVEKSVSILKKNPYYQIRYKNIRCLPLHKFPFMLHFELDEHKKQIKILGCIHTSLNPADKWR